MNFKEKQISKSKVKEKTVIYKFTIHLKGIYLSTINYYCQLFNEGKNIL